MYAAPLHLCMLRACRAGTVRSSYSLVCKLTRRPYSSEDPTKPSARLVVTSNEDKDSRLPSTHVTKVKDAVKDVGYGAVLLGGITLTGLILYMIIRELFSRKSPNGVYKAAFDLCKRDTRDLLGSNIKAHGETSHRGRRRHTAHSSWKDAQGRLHMAMKFHLQGTMGTGVVHLEVYENSNFPILLLLQSHSIRPAPFPQYSRSTKNHTTILTRSNPSFPTHLQPCQPTLPSPPVLPPFPLTSIRFNASHSFALTPWKYPHPPNSLSPIPPARLPPRGGVPLHIITILNLLPHIAYPPSDPPPKPLHSPRILQFLLPPPSNSHPYFPPLPPPIPMISSSIPRIPVRSTPKAHPPYAPSRHNPAPLP
ncbi:unnamed protein product [Dicrocoelium dendriticum]|nr:unnamed protein product [Dicrocoelium dendriticum]